MPETGKTQRTIVWAIVVLFCATIAGVVLLATLVEDASAYVTPLLGSMAPTIAVLAAMRAIESVRQDTHALTNGLLDRKTRAAVAEVLDDELLDPQYRDSQTASVDTAAQGHQSRE